MPETHPCPPDLEPRFLPPEGWRWHVFEYRGRKIRFGTVSPKDSVPDGAVVCLEGLSEYGEKYFEIAHDLLARNLSVWVMDWQGQGKSHRHLRNPQARYARDFQDDVDDLSHFINEYVMPAAVHPDVGRLPLVMLAHSMGSNIGLRYLHQNPGVFSCAAFSAPMLAIAALEAVPRLLRTPLTWLFKTMAGQCYVPGGRDWSKDVRETPALNIFSDDPVRMKVHNTWCIFDPALRVGNVVWAWLYAAGRSCAYLQKPDVMRAIETPSLIALAGKEHLLDNRRIREAVAHMPHATILELAESKHEIFMERDAIRGAFFENFDALLKKTDIKNKRQPF